jgi:hypothetical protein
MLPVIIGIAGALLSAGAALLITKADASLELLLVIPGSGLTNWIVTGMACSRTDASRSDLDRFGSKVLGTLVGFLAAVLTVAAAITATMITLHYSGFWNSLSSIPG